MFGGDDKEGEADDIVYDEKAVNALLDRSQEGLEEKESWANEYLSSFKVATYQVKETVEEEVEVLKEQVDTADPAYWEKLLGTSYVEQQEAIQKKIDKEMGKGRRTRRK